METRTDTLNETHSSYTLRSFWNYTKDVTSTLEPLVNDTIFFSSPS